MKKQVKFPLLLLVIIILLMNSLGQITSVYAITTVDSTTSTKESKHTIDPLKESNDLLDSNSIVVPSETVPEYSLKTEAKYEDNELLSTFEKDTTSPAIIFETKQLMQEVYLKGEVKAGRIEKNGVITTVELLQMKVQRKLADDDWEDYYAFDMEGPQKISIDSFVFEFSENLPEEELLSYRIVADYEVVEHYGDKEMSRNLGRGNYLLGMIEVSNESVGESSDFELKAETLTGSSMEKGVHPPELKEDPEQPQPSEEISLHEEIETETSESTEKGNEASSSFSLFSRTPELPTMMTEDMKQNQLTGLRSNRMIMPMASNNAGVYITDIYKSGSIQYPRSTFLDVVVIDSKFTSLTTANVTLEFSYNYRNHSGERRVFSSDYDGSGVGMARATGFYTAEESVVNTLSSIQLNVNPPIGIANATSSLAYAQDGTGYPYITERVRYTVTNMKAGTEWTCFYRTEAADQPRYNVTMRYHLHIPSPNLVELTGVSTPVFEAINENTTTINMNRGTYTGDVLDNVGGTFDIATTGGFWQHRNNIGHTNTRNGTYYVSQPASAKESIGGLAAGTEYTARIGLQNAFGNWRYSANTIFRTPNSVNQPAMSARNNPTASNNATASFLGTYNVGAKPAHPPVNAANVRARISTNNANWTNVTISGVTINQSTRQVGYTIGGLAPNTIYYTQYAVRNSSNAWSPWSASRQFTTNAVALSISTPTVNQGRATANTIEMNAGTYSGNVSTAHANNGIVRVNDGNGWVNKTTSLVHDRTLGGSYNRNSNNQPYIISGLTAGTTYQLQVGLRNAVGTYLYSTSRVFHTPNIANKPNTPTLNTPTMSNNATATFTGTYVAGATPAHPSGTNVKVLISENGAPYVNASLAATPVVSTDSKKVTFTVKDLKVKTNYKIKYSVLNSSTVWSNEAESDVFTTKGIGLTIYTPTFDQNSATSSSILMNQGSYTGDITQADGQGKIELTGNSGTDSETVVNNLEHDLMTNGNYDSWLVSGLKPGTRYQGTVVINDYEGIPTYASNPSKWSDYFYTKNAVNQPDVSAQTPPSNMFNAKANFTATYEAGDTTGKYTPAHPDEVEAEISTDDLTWKAIDSNSSPKLATSQITDSTRTVEFSLEKLRANTTYYVRYRLKNNGGWSDWSASREFTTLGLPSGLYITDFPSFDFGMLNKESFAQTAVLSNDSIKNHLVIDNSDATVGWSLSAKLEPLTRTTDAQVMPWATMRMDINLQNTTDGGSSWQNYTTGVTGSPGTLTLNSGAPAKTLWSINIPADAQGTFRNEIDWTSVELDVPANQEGYYQGKLVWSLDSIP